MKKIGAMVLCCMLATTAEAGGFSSPNMSASGLGVANAVVAGADDVSAAAYNPAGIAWQDGIQVMAGVNLQYRDSSVDLGTNIGPNLGDAPVPAHLYTSWMPRDSDFGLALAFNRPFEMDNDWSDAFPGTAGITTIKMDRVSLDTIYRLNSSMAFSAGVDWYISSATIDAFSASDLASFGGHLSMKWKPAPMWSVGALARLGSDITLSGGAGQSLKIKLPDEFTLGVARDFADAVRLEVDANWSRWSKLDNLNVTPGGTAISLDMQDSLTLMVGATWFWRENSQFRFGYAYDEGANGTTGFHPAIADQTGHKMSLGAGGDMFGIHADIAYAYTFYPESSVTGPFAGIYRDRRQSFALSISKGF
ncbi:MAG: outer membrane protein transport protein [Mariprofundaceae bacterium]